MTPDLDRLRERAMIPAKTFDASDVLPLLDELAAARKVCEAAQVAKDVWSQWRIYEVAGYNELDAALTEWRRVRGEKT